MGTLNNCGGKPHWSWLQGESRTRGWRPILAIEFSWRFNSFYRTLLWRFPKMGAIFPNHPRHETMTYCWNNHGFTTGDPNHFRNTPDDSVSGLLPRVVALSFWCDISKSSSARCHSAAFLKNSERGYRILQNHGIRSRWNSQQKISMSKYIRAASGKLIK